MFKNIYRKILLFFFGLVGLFFTIQANAKWSDYIRIRYGSSGGGLGNTGGPDIPCSGLPGCKGPEGVVIKFIDKTIEIVAVLAVFALILSGILYIISSGDEEKSKRAKRWILWSLIGVFLAGSAWGIIKLLNNISF